MHLVVLALSHNPITTLGVGRVLFRHEAVAELHLVFTELSEVVAPLRVTTKCCIISFRSLGYGSISKIVETWLVLVLALAISSLMRPIFGFLVVALAHGGR